MHWEPRNVNPMLALRTGECNDRWNETRNQAFRQRLKTRLSSRFTRQEERSNELKQKVNEGILNIFSFCFLSLNKNIRSSCFFFQADLDPPSPYISETKTLVFPLNPIPEALSCAKT